jgi:hypothetical protein
MGGRRERDNGEAVAAAQFPEFNQGYIHPPQVLRGTKSVFLISKSGIFRVDIPH